MARKLLSVLIALSILVTIGLTGCGGNAKQGDSITNEKVDDAKKAEETKKEEPKAKITLWMAAQTPERDQIMNGLITEFTTKNPNIEVEYLGIPGDSNAGKSKIEMAIAAGTGPDVHNNFLADYIKRGNLEPLNAYFDKWELKGNISESSIASNKTMDPKKETLYGMPFIAQVKCFWIRSDWYKAANIPIPENWDQFIDSARKLTDKSKGVFGHSIRGGGGSSQNLEFMLYSYSGITEAFNKDGKSTINDPRHIEFVEKYLSLYKEFTPEDDLTKGWTELAATFQSGKAASIFHNLGSATTNEKVFNSDFTKFEMLTFPKSVQGTVVHPMYQPEGFCIGSYSKEKNAAWKLVAYLTSGNAASEICKFFGGIPVEKTAAEAAWVKEKPYMQKSAAFMKDPNVKYFEEPTYMPQYRNILTKTAEPLMQAVMVKKTTAKEFLDKWADEMTKAKAEYDAANK